MKKLRLLILLAMFAALFGGVVISPAAGVEKVLPNPPTGIESKFRDLAEPPTPDRVTLGRHLFFEKRLSVDGSVSCATCHNPANAFSMPTAVATGVRGQKGLRKSPSIVNLAWPLNPNFFWDGRAKSLEEQAKGPITDPKEMGNTLENAVSTIAGIQGYVPLFEAAFGSSEVTIERISRAIADYERTRMSGNSPFDRWQDGDYEAMTTRKRKGHEVFVGIGQCNQCHLGENFTDGLFHNSGVGWDPKLRKFSDVGRFKVSNANADMGAFKTPGLRDLTKRAPYMHDGSMKTLREVVLHYNKGGNKNPHLSPKLQPLNLTEHEISCLVEFLESLDGEGYMDSPPAPLP